MAANRNLIGLGVIVAVVLSIAIPRAQAQDPAATPAPAPTSDGASIDQGIAYLLMIVALVLTYLIHPMDASPFNLF